MNNFLKIKNCTLNKIYKIKKMKYLLIKKLIIQNIIRLFIIVLKHCNNNYNIKILKMINIYNY